MECKNIWAFVCESRSHVFLVKGELVFGRKFSSFVSLFVPSQVSGGNRGNRVDTETSSVECCSLLSVVYQSHPRTVYDVMNGFHFRARRCGYTVER